MTWKMHLILHLFFKLISEYSLFRVVVFDKSVGFENAYLRCIVEIKRW